MLYRVLEDTSLGGPAAVNRALRPWWPILWRLAARGHYAQTGQPVREPATRQDGFYQTPLPPITEHPFTLSFARGEATEFSVLLSLPGIRQPLYPISSYPKIAEFRAMLAALAPPSQVRSWNGEYFFGYVQGRIPSNPPRSGFAPTTTASRSGSRRTSGPLWTRSFAARGNLRTFSGPGIT